MKHLLFTLVVTGLLATGVLPVLAQSEDPDTTNTHGARIDTQVERDAWTGALQLDSLFSKAPIALPATENPSVYLMDSWDGRFLMLEPDTTYQPDPMTVVPLFGRPVLVGGVPTPRPLPDTESEYPMQHFWTLTPELKRLNLSYAYADGDLGMVTENIFFSSTDADESISGSKIFSGLQTFTGDVDMLSGVTTISNLRAPKTGTLNEAISEDALGELTVGFSNTAFGGRAGENVTEGSNNTFLGAGAGAEGSLFNFGPTDGDDNTFIGAYAGQGADVDDGTFVGSGAGSNSSGNQITAIGRTAGIGATGSRQTLIGYQAGNASAFTESIAIGFQANPTADNQIMIGKSGGTLTGIIHGLIDFPDGITVNNGVSSRIGLDDSVQGGYILGVDGLEFYGASGTKFIDIQDGVGTVDLISGTTVGGFGIVLDAGSQTLAGNKTFSATAYFTAGAEITNQLTMDGDVLLYNGHYLRFNEGFNNATIQATSLTSNPVLEIPDIGTTTADIVVTEGAQIINGSKTFAGASDMVSITSGTFSLTSAFADIRPTDFVMDLGAGFGGAGGSVGPIFYNRNNLGGGVTLTAEPDANFYTATLPAITGGFVMDAGNQTVAGDKSMTGQVELTNQAATTDDSAMTRGLGDARYLPLAPIQLSLNNYGNFTVTGSGVGNDSGGLSLIVYTGTTSGSTAHARNGGFGASYFAKPGAPISGGNAGIDFSSDWILSYRAFTYDATNDPEVYTDCEVWMKVGMPRADTSTAQPTTKGCGFTMRDGAWFAWVHDGTTYTESASSFFSSVGENPALAHSFQIKNEDGNCFFYMDGVLRDTITAPTGYTGQEATAISFSSNNLTSTDNIALTVQYPITFAYIND